MKLKIPIPSEKIVGGLRLPEAVFEKVQILAGKHGVSNQEIIRHILVNVIDDVE
jgi:predicted DNA binding CopG/RHH family protein